jgi:hypothetical protein
MLQFRKAQYSRQAGKVFTGQSNSEAARQYTAQQYAAPQFAAQQYAAPYFVA